MKPRYSFSSKKSRRATESPKMLKQRGKYPDILKKIIEQSDIILEILDARFPRETQNIELETKIKNQNKNIIYVLNKSDILSKKEKSNLSPSVYVSCKNRTGIRQLRDLIKILAKKIKKDEEVIVGIAGYPNTGKSSLINLLIGRSSAGTGADAGFTKGIQKLKLTSNIILLDTPGVIPKAEYSQINNEAIAKHTIVGGRSWSQVKEPEIVIAKLIQAYPKVLEEHYKIKANDDAEILLEELGKRLNYFEKGNEVNIDRTARKILKDWQNGEIKI